MPCFALNKWDVPFGGVRVGPHKISIKSGWKCKKQNLNREAWL